MRIDPDIHTNDNRHHLIRMGWTSHFQKQLDAFSNDGAIPARVVGIARSRFRTSDGQNEWPATLAGRLKHDAQSPVPVTGDWVLLTDTVIVKVLIRKNALSRGASGTRHKQHAQPQREQVIAANLDSVFIVCGLDRDFNLRRIERYVALVYNCGLTPVIVLTKADLHRDPLGYVSEVEAVTLRVPVHLISAWDNTGLNALESYLSPGRTTTLVGSSGAGKSTLLNRLYGRPVQRTGAVSTQVGKGRHTTTSRELIRMPQGGMVIDNPGIREIAFWEVQQGVDAAFPEIDAFSAECRFADCRHTHEPGCRVLAAVEAGEIPADRLENYRKMRREMDYLDHRRHKSSERVEKERWKSVALKIKAMKKKR